jgi:hypothetical protein
MCRDHPEEWAQPSFVKVKPQDVSPASLQTISLQAGNGFSTLAAASAQAVPDESHPNAADYVISCRCKTSSLTTPRDHSHAFARRLGQQKLLPPVHPRETHLGRSAV